MSVDAPSDPTPPSLSAPVTPPDGHGGLSAWESNPLRGLSAVLAAVPIAVAYEQLYASGTGGIQVVRVGMLAADPLLAARRGHTPAVPDNCHA